MEERIIRNWRGKERWKEEMVGWKRSIWIERKDWRIWDWEKKKSEDDR